MSSPPPPSVTPNPAFALLSRTMSPAVNLPSRPRDVDPDAGSEAAAATAAAAAPAFKVPKLRLEIRDLTHPAASRFLGAVNVSDCAAAAVRNVLCLLYTSPACPTTTVPPTRSVTLILRDMGGVAYTTGSDLDDDHKEVHLSLAYLARQSDARLGPEVTGVLTHELVHCFQYNGFATCPGGLIEGIADWVRLRCRLEPPHWKREADGRWDAGYQRTAYFLDYLERRFGHGTVQRINEKLRIQRYEEKAFWTELLGRPVAQLWADYCENLLKDEEAVVVKKDDISGDEKATSTI
jgi:hypothetical protein